MAIDYGIMVCFVDTSHRTFEPLEIMWFHKGERLKVISFYWSFSDCLFYMLG